MVGLQTEGPSHAAYANRDEAICDFKKEGGDLACSKKYHILGFYCVRIICCEMLHFMY